MKRQLKEPVASNRLSDHAKVLRIRRRGRQYLGGVRKTRKRIEAGVERKVTVWRIEIRMVENVERVRLEFQGDAFGDLEVLEKRQIEACLEWGAEDITSVGPVAGF